MADLHVSRDVRKLGSFDTSPVPRDGSNPDRICASIFPLEGTAANVNLTPG